MGRVWRGIASVGFLAIALLSLRGFAQAAVKDDASAMVITFKDGHQQTFSLSDIARIEFRTPETGMKPSASAALLPSRRHFIGKWTVGDGTGKTYLFTLEEDGQASNNVDGGGHGTWTYIDGEAHVSWDNGWHDAIRKSGSKHQKFAYAPGRSFDDTPSNVGEAKKTNAEPI